MKDMMHQCLFIICIINCFHQEAVHLYLSCFCACLCLCAVWKFSLKAEPLSRGNLSPQSNFCPFNLNLKSYFHPPACISCLYSMSKSDPVNTREQLIVKPQISSTGEHTFCQNNVSDSNVLQRFSLKIIHHPEDAACFPILISLCCGCWRCRDTSAGRKISRICFDTVKMT